MPAGEVENAFSLSTSAPAYLVGDLLKDGQLAHVQLGVVLGRGSGGDEGQGGGGGELKKEKVEV